MYHMFMSEWFSERRAISALSNGRKRVPYVYNGGDHKMTNDFTVALDSKYTELCFYVKMQLISYNHVIRF